MKVVDKTTLDTNSKVKQLINEKQIMQSLNHPFIIKLHWSFQSRKQLHFVMDFCAGGELFYHLHNVGRLNEEQAKFYFAEILLAIEYLHSRGIVYRDLKPENVLLDIDGHICLADFGLSKEGMSLSNETNSFCGSPEYMSPEMLKQKGHTLTVDYYCLGALVYEMIIGLPPHYSTNKEHMYRGILDDEVEIPDTISRSLKDFLLRLLIKNPKNRLGAKRGISELKEHSWCIDIDWNEYMAKKIKPPFKPSLDHSQFDPEYVNTEQKGYSCYESDFNYRYKGFSFERKTHIKINALGSSLKVLNTDRKLKQKENIVHDKQLYSDSCKNILIPCDNGESFENRFNAVKGGTISARSTDYPNLVTGQSVLNLLSKVHHMKTKTCSQESIKQHLHKDTASPENAQRILLKSKGKIVKRPLVIKKERLATMDKFEDYFKTNNKISRTSTLFWSANNREAKHSSKHITRNTYFKPKVKVLNKRNQTIENRTVKSQQDLYTGDIQCKVGMIIKNLKLRKSEIISLKAPHKNKSSRKGAVSQMKCENSKKSPMNKGKILTNRSKKKMEFPNKKSLISKNELPKHRKMLSYITNS